MLIVVYRSKLLNVNFRNGDVLKLFAFSPGKPVQFLTVSLLPSTQPSFLIRGLELLGGNWRRMLKSRFDVPIIRPYLKCHVSETNEMECRDVKLIRHETTLEGGK